MGRVILCTGNRAKNPYSFRSTGTRVYTIEEMCYYISKNVETAGEDLLSDPVTDFFRDELGLPERADKLAELYGKSAGVKEVAVVVLCSSDYFGEHEVKKILSELKKLEDMTGCEKKKVFADRALKAGRLREAFELYLEIIEQGDESGLNDRDYASVLHNTAVIYAKNDSFPEAVECYQRAFTLSKNPETKKQLMFAVSLSGQDMMYSELLKESDTDGTLVKEFDETLSKLREGEDSNVNFTQIKRMKKLLYDGRINEYESMASDMIDMLKTRYRSRNDKT